MKTTNQYRKNRICILFLLTTIMLFPFISNAQLNLNSTGGVAIGSSTVTPTTGLNVNSGGVLVSGGVAVSGGTVPSTGLLVNSGGAAISGGTVPANGLLVNSGGASISGGTVPSTGLNVNAGNINLNSATNSYQINSNKILWHNNTTSNIFVGFGAGAAITTGTGNSFVGYNAGNVNTSGLGNSFIGADAGKSNTSGSYNTFIGNTTGQSNTTGYTNSFMGWGAGQTNTTGYSNIFVGNGAGGLNTTGYMNSFIGYNAGYSNTVAYANTFMGYQAGKNTTTSSGNSVFGFEALFTNSTGGGSNSAFGYHCLYDNTTGINNNAFGVYALTNTTSGSANTAIGRNAGSVNTTGSNNTFVGYNADANAGTYSNATAIGNGAIVTVSNSVTFGNSSVTKLYAAVTTITAISDGRFKNNIKEDVQGLAFINKLRPVTYNLDTKKLDDYLIQNMPDSIKIAHKQGMDFTESTAMVRSGFIAQEVEQAAEDIGFKSSIVGTPSDGTNLYGLGYSEFVVPLVKAVQELSKITDSLTIIKTQQDSIIDTQNSKIVDIQNQLIQLTRTINTCCAVPDTKGLKNLTEGNSQTNVDLNNLQTIVLAQNVPNPFAEQTTINYFLPDNTGKAQMLFYDASGMLIKSVDLIQKGKGALNVFANDLTNGIYTYTLVMDGQIIESKKMVKQ